MNIYQFFSYRDYLRDFYEHKKSLNPKFSYRVFARKAGFSSSSVYKSLTDGTRNLTDSLVPKFVKALGLEDRERDYFLLLVEFTHAGNADSKQRIFERMTALMPRSIQKLRQNQIGYYQQWFHVAVREALAIIDVSDDFEDLARFISPPIKISQVKTTIKLLSSLDLIRKDDRGYWKSHLPLVTSGEAMEPWVIHGFQKTMMMRAIEALDRIPKSDRNISTATVSISREGAERIIHLLSRTKDEILNIARSDAQEERVFQLNFQFFPLSEKKKKE